MHSDDCSSLFDPPPPYSSRPPSFQEGDEQSQPRQRCLFHRILRRPCEAQPATLAPPSYPITTTPTLTPTPQTTQVTAPTPTPAFPSSTQEDPDPKVHSWHSLLHSNRPLSPYHHALLTEYKLATGAAWVDLKRVGGPTSSFATQQMYERHLAGFETMLDKASKKFEAQGSGEERRRAFLEACETRKEAYKWAREGLMALRKRDGLN